MFPENDVSKNEDCTPSLPSTASASRNVKIPKPSSQPNGTLNSKTQPNLPLPRINYNQKYKLELSNEMKTREELYNEFCKNSRKFKNKFKNLNYYRDQSLFSNINQFREKIKDINNYHSTLLSNDRINSTPDVRKNISYRDN